MKFNQGEIAEIYGYDLAELVTANDEGKLAYLRGKLYKLNNALDLRNFVGYLDKRNQQNFKRVFEAKTAWIKEL